MPHCRSLTRDRHSYRSAKPTGGPPRVTGAIGWLSSRASWAASSQLSLGQPSWPETSLVEASLQPSSWALFQRHSSPPSSLPSRRVNSSKPLPPNRLLISPNLRHLPPSPGRTQPSPQLFPQMSCSPILVPPVIPQSRIADGYAEVWRGMVRRFLPLRGLQEMRTGGGPWKSTQSALIWRRRSITLLA